MPYYRHCTASYQLRLLASELIKRYFATFANAAKYYRRLTITAGATRELLVSTIAGSDQKYARSGSGE